MNIEIQNLCMKLGLHGIDEQKVEDACSSLGDEVVLGILQKMVKEGPRKNGTIIELRASQFNRMVKAIVRQEAQKSKSESFLQEQEEQMQIRDKERASGFQPTAESLKALIERMYIDSGDISSEEYEAAINFLGVPVGERQEETSDDFDIPF